MAPGASAPTSRRRARSPGRLRLRDLRPATTPDEHVAAIEKAIVRLGRDLHYAELAIDVVGLDRDLALAKDRLEQALQEAKRRALRRFLRGGPFRIETPPEVEAILRGLYEAGVEHAREEIVRRAGRPLVLFAASDPPVLRALLDRVEGLSLDLSIRTENRLVRTDLSAVSTAALARRVERIPGARDVASRVVSSGLFAGIGEVYDRNAGLFETWVYSAVMDAATCGVCRSYDGTVYASWAEIQQVLPNGGPNPRCLGDGRCRCRVVPGDFDPVVAAAPNEPPPWAGDEYADALARASFDDRELFLATNGQGPLIGVNGYPNALALEREAALRRAGARVADEVERRVKAAGLPTRATLKRRHTKAQREFNDAFAEHSKAIDDELERLVRERFGVSADEFRLSGEVEDWLRLRNEAKGAVPAGRVARARTAMREAEDELAGLDRRVLEARVRHTREALEELRPFAGRGDLRLSYAERVVDDSGVIVQEGPTAQRAETMRRATESFPRAWVETSNERGEVRLLADAHDDRGYHRVVGDDAEIALSSRLAPLDERDHGWPVAVHELAHRMQHTNARLRLYETLFHLRRTTLSERVPDRERKRLRDLYPNSTYRDDEVTQPDRFVDPYIGKRYRPDYDLDGYGEVLTMGLEGLFTGSYDVWQDRELVDLLLGLLAGV